MFVLKDVLDAALHVAAGVLAVCGTSMRCHADIPRSVFLLLCLKPTSPPAPASLAERAKTWIQNLDCSPSMESDPPPLYLPIVAFHPPFLCVFQYLDTKSESPIRFLFQKPGYKIWTLSLTRFCHSHPSGYLCLPFVQMFHEPSYELPVA